MTVIDALRRTGVDHRAAAALLGGGGEMLTALLESSQGDLSGTAHDLLVQLHGRDLGRRPEDWRRWIATLDVNGSTDVGDSTSGPGVPDRSLLLTGDLWRRKLRRRILFDSPAAELPS